MYFKVILHSVVYSDLSFGAGYVNTEPENSFQTLHCRASRVIFNLRRDVSYTDFYVTGIPSEIHETASRTNMLRFIKLFYKVFSGKIFVALSSLKKKHLYVF